MNCPACGSILKETKTKKGVTFLVCTSWPTCRVSGTPELIEQIQKPQQPRGPVHLGSFITQVAQMRIHQSKLGKAKTSEERNTIRKQALEALQ